MQELAEKDVMCAVGTHLSPLTVQKMASLCSLHYVADNDEKKHTLEGLERDRPVKELEQHMVRCREQGKLAEQAGIPERVLRRANQVWTATLLTEDATSSILEKLGHDLDKLHLKRT